MPRRKKTKKVEEKNKALNEQLAEIVDGLIYIRETDAAITPFAGKTADAVTKENLASQIGPSGTTNVEEKDFNKFFAPLVKFQDWFGEDERKMTEKFVRLKDLLQQNLRDLKVFRLGKKEIDIFVVGLDQENILRGIQTKAVET